MWTTCITRCLKQEKMSYFVFVLAHSLFGKYLTSETFTCLILETEWVYFDYRNKFLYILA